MGCRREQILRLSQWLLGRQPGTLDEEGNLMMITESLDVKTLLALASRLRRTLQGFVLFCTGKHDHY